jgi:hypothetical protein
MFSRQVLFIDNKAMIPAGGQPDILLAAVRMAFLEISAMERDLGGRARVWSVEWSGRSY